MPAAAARAPALRPSLGLLPCWEAREANHAPLPLLALQPSVIPWGSSPAAARRGRCAQGRPNAVDAFSLHLHLTAHSPQHLCSSGRCSDSCARAWGVLRAGMRASACSTSCSPGPCGLGGGEGGGGRRGGRQHTAGGANLREQSAPVRSGLVRPSAEHWRRGEVGHPPA